MDRIKLFYSLFLVLLLLLLFQFGQALPVSAAEDPCDPDLPRPSDDPLGYQLRDDRCEGRYDFDRGGTIQIRSLTESFEDYNLKSGEDLIVEWSVPKDQKVHLRVQGLKPSVRYRMDAIRSPGSTSYRWPVDILRALNILRGDIGVVAWARYSMNGVGRDVYLPLQIRQTQQAVQSGVYRVVLWPDRELAEVFVSLATVKADGSPGNFIKDGEALNYGYYPAERGIEFEIPKPERPGIYYLELGATLRSGGVITIESWFYHAG
jgi:hypothetical protein